MPTDVAEKVAKAVTETKPEPAKADRDKAMILEKLDLQISESRFLNKRPPTMLWLSAHDARLLGESLGFPKGDVTYLKALKHRDPKGIEKLGFPISIDLSL